MENKILVIVGHPNLKESIASKTIIEELLKNDKLNISILNIMEQYPDWNINFLNEQERLIKFDHIVLLFPFYWYNCPAILKKYIDDVFTYSFAYGKMGDKLKDKQLTLIVTVGGPKESYNLNGYNSLPVRNYLMPFEQLAKSTQMKWNEPFIINKIFHNNALLQEDAKIKDIISGEASKFASKIIETWTK